MGVLRWLFDLVIIVGYFAAAFVLGSWLMAVAPFVLALLAVAVAVIRGRLDESEPPEDGSQGEARGGLRDGADCERRAIPDDLR